MYRWSSARAHMEGKDDILVKVMPLLKIAGDWQDFLEYPDEAVTDRLRQHEKTGRPLGGMEFIGCLEERLLRKLQPQKPGPKKEAAHS